MGLGRDAHRSGAIIKTSRIVMPTKISEFVIHNTNLGIISLSYAKEYQCLKCSCGKNQEKKSFVYSQSFMLNLYCGI